MAPVKEIPIPNIPITASAPTEPEKAKKKPAAIKLDGSLEADVRMLVTMGFGLAATVTKLDVWALSGEEAKKISEPLTRIMQRMGISETMSKYADYIALTAALTVVTVPRAIVTMAIMEERKTNERKTGTIQQNHQTTIGTPSAGNAADAPNLRPYDFGLAGQP